MNRVVNLTKRVQTSRGLRYCPVVEAANGRVKSDVVIVNGQEERHPEGGYYIDWTEGTKRLRVSVGRDAQDAAAACKRKAAELNAKGHGIAIVAEEGKTTIAAAKAEYLDEIKLTKKPKTLAAYTTSHNSTSIS